MSRFFQYLICSSLLLIQLSVLPILRQFLRAKLLQLHSHQLIFCEVLLALALALALLLDKLFGLILANWLSLGPREIQPCNA